VCPVFHSLPFSTFTNLQQATTAYALKKVWPEIILHIVPDAGHSSREPGISKLLVEVRQTYLKRKSRLILFRQPTSLQHSTKVHKFMTYKINCYIVKCDSIRGGY